MSVPPVAPPPPPPPPPPGVPGGGAAVPAQNQKALWALICSIVGLVCCGGGLILGIVAIVLSNQAKNEIQASGGQQSGAGMAQSALILGIIGIVLSVIAVPFYFSTFN